MNQVRVYAINQGAHMSGPGDLEFVTRHFRDLQTIRFAPLPLAMILLAIVQRTPHNRAGALTVVLLFVFSVTGFYAWSTRAIKRRYGSVKESRDEAQRMRYHPVILLLHLAFVAALTWAYFFSRGNFWNIYPIFTIVIYMLIKILDPTNLQARRIAWGLGLGVLAIAGSFLVSVDSAAPLAVLGGVVWLSLSLYDFLLLRRIFEESMHHG